MVTSASKCHQTPLQMINRHGDRVTTHQAGGVHGHDDRLLLLSREQLRTLKQQVREGKHDSDILLQKLVCEEKS